MITRYIMAIPDVPGHRLYPDSAYRLYACLLEQLPPEYSQMLHASGGRWIRQFLKYDKDTSEYRWHLSILTDAGAEMLMPVLDGLHDVQIEHQSFPIVQKEAQQVSLEFLLRQSTDTTRTNIAFLTPTAFRQSGRYTIFPQERLILQSLISRWNEVFPECPLEDPDAFEALLTGLHIVDYHLKTTRFSLKGIRIPGFTGSCIVEAKLAPPLLALWNTLAEFSNDAGIGIKTSIGMGGTKVSAMSAFLK